MEKRTKETAERKKISAQIIDVRVAEEEYVILKIGFITVDRPQPRPGRLATVNMARIKITKFGKSSTEFIVTR